MNKYLLKVKFIYFLRKCIVYLLNGLLFFIEKMKKMRFTNWILHTKFFDRSKDFNMSIKPPFRFIYTRLIRWWYILFNCYEKLPKKLDKWLHKELVVSMRKMELKQLRETGKPFMGSYGREEFSDIK